VDCDDTRSCVTTNCTKVDWYLDKDSDGSYAEKKNEYKSCKPIGSWNLTSNKGLDCDDNRVCVTTNCTKVDWYLDNDANHVVQIIVLNGIQHLTKVLIVMIIFMTFIIYLLTVLEMIITPATARILSCGSFL